MSISQLICCSLSIILIDTEDSSSLKGLGKVREKHNFKVFGESEGLMGVMFYMSCLLIMVNSLIFLGIGNLLGFHIWL
jgi:hypothetical protein